jgi:hypothetical protein
LAVGSCHAIFWVYTTQGVPSVPIQRRDVLFDEQNTDPETGQLAKYRVAGVVETFANDHQEALSDTPPGLKPQGFSVHPRSLRHESPQALPAP